MTNSKNFSIWNKAVELFLTAINTLLSVIGISFVMVCVFIPGTWEKTFTFEKKERYVQPPFRDSTSALDTITEVW
jgi:hypothetical protein